MRPFLNSGFKACGGRGRDGFVRISDSLRRDLSRARDMLGSPSAQPLDLAFQHAFINGMICGVPSARPGYGEWSTDASGGADAKLAIFCRGKFASHPCSPDEARYLSIGILEALAVHAGLISFGADIRDSVLVALCDNAGVCQAVNSGKCRNPALAECVAAIAGAAADSQCTFGLNHIRSAANCASDALSRNDHAAFGEFCALHGYTPHRVEWPQQTTALAAHLVRISRDHARARGLDELVAGPPGIVGAASYPCDVRLSPAETELARALGDLHFM